MADAVAGYLPGSLCSIRIEASDDSHISIYPGFPEVLAAALEQVGIMSIKPTLASAAIDKLSDDARKIADEDMYRAKLKHRQLAASAADRSKVAAFAT